MSSAVQLDWQTEKFRSALDRYMRDSKRDVKAVMRQQVKKIVERIISITPPSDGKTTGTTAKQHGETAVVGDIRKIVTRASKKQLEKETERTVIVNEAQLKAWHKKNRASRGRTNKLSDKDKAIAVAEVINAYIKDKKKQVGYLASGWRAAASKLGAKVPGWISRNSGPGSAAVTENARGVNIQMHNRIKWARVKDSYRRLRWAVDAQRGALEKQIQNNLKRRAASF